MLNSRGQAQFFAALASETTPLQVPSQEVALQSPAVVVNPVQHTTYDLTASSTKFGSTTNITASKAVDGVFGSAAMDWTITNAGHIEGRYGILLDSLSKVTNSGSISSVYYDAVYMKAGGNLTNTRSGSITGNVGVEDGGEGGVVINSGTIAGYSGGVRLEGGGTLENLFGGNITESDQGLFAVSAGDNTIVTNAGDISSTQGGGGVALDAGCTFDNWASGVVTGQVMGLGNTGDTIVNVGAITLGIYLQTGGVITNKTGGTITGGIRIADSPGQPIEITNQKGASISETPGGLANAAIDIFTLPAAKITNAGNLTGSSGVLIAVGSVDNEVGGDIQGSYSGVGVQGTGQVTNAGSISGSHHGISIYGGTVTNDAGGVVSGNYGIQVYIQGGRITNAGKVLGVMYGVDTSGPGQLTNLAGGYISGNIAVYGLEPGLTVTNAGTIKGGADGVRFGRGGQISNLAGGNISGADGVYAFSGAATVTNAGTISGTSDAVELMGAGANKLILQTGSKLIGAAVGSTASGATNALILQGTGAAANWFQNFTTLSKQGTGTWTLSGESAIGSTRVSAGALIVTNYLRSSFEVLSGATLQIGNASRGGKVIGNGAFSNNGVIRVDTGLAEVTGALSGGGSAVIAGGTLEFDSSFTQNVNFSGASGVLQLARSQNYTGSISGFSHTGSTSLDLRDIGFISGKTKASLVENGAKTSGLLTVTDGTHIAKIKLNGDYTGVTFSVSNDGHSGTTVVDMTKTMSPAVPSLVVAMAGFSVGGGNGLPAAASGRSSPTTLLVPPAIIPFAAAHEDAVSPPFLTAKQRFIEAMSTLRYSHGGHAEPLHAWNYSDRIHPALFASTASPH